MEALADKMTWPWDLLLNDQAAVVGDGWGWTAGDLSCCSPNSHECSVFFSEGSDGPGFEFCCVLLPLSASFPSASAGCCDAWERVWDASSQPRAGAPRGQVFFTISEGARSIHVDDLSTNLPTTPPRGCCEDPRSCADTARPTSPSKWPLWDLNQGCGVWSLPCRPSPRLTARDRVSAALPPPCPMPHVVLQPGGAWGGVSSAARGPKEARPL